MTTRVRMTKAQMKAAIIQGMTDVAQSYMDVEIIDGQDEAEAYIVTVVQAAGAFANNTRIAARLTGIRLDD